MNDNNLKPEQFRSIAAECVEACKVNTKGKAKQETILTVLRKRAGFQSNQTLDNAIKPEDLKKSESSDQLLLRLVEGLEVLGDGYYGEEEIPLELETMLSLVSTYRESNPVIYENVDQFYSAFFSIDGSNYPSYSDGFNKAQTKLFESLFLKENGKNFFYEVASSNDQMGLSVQLDSVDGVRREDVYLLSKKDSGNIIYELTGRKDVEYVVYVDTYLEEGCFLGDPDVVDGTLRTFDKFSNAVDYVKKLIA